MSCHTCDIYFTLFWKRIHFTSIKNKIVKFIFSQYINFDMKSLNYFYVKLINCLYLKNYNEKILQYKSKKKKSSQS